MRKPCINDLDLPTRRKPFMDRLLQKLRPGQMLRCQSKAKRGRFSHRDNPVGVAFITGDFVAPKAQAVDPNAALKESRFAVGSGSKRNTMAGIWHENLSHQFVILPEVFSPPVAKSMWILFCHVIQI